MLHRDNADQIGQAYALYRGGNTNTNPRSVAAALFRKMYSYETDIRFIGVWDTVGALGIPSAGGRLARRFNRRYEFHDTTLSSKVGEAYQALAIDERRGPFVPTIWSKSDMAPPTQRLEQVWFTGSHSDVGGGNRHHGLSDIALCWMLEKARGAGLAFVERSFLREPPAGGEPVSGDEIVEEYTRINPNPAQEVDPSRKGIYRFLPPHSREGRKRRQRVHRLDGVPARAVTRLVESARPLRRSGAPDRAGRPGQRPDPGRLDLRQQRVAHR